VSTQRRVDCRRGTVSRPGFTLIEVIIVVMIAAILGGVAVPQIGKFTSRRAVSNASDAFIRTAAQARAAAIRTGDEVVMRVDAANDRVTIVTAAGDTVATLDLANGPIQAGLEIPSHTGTGPFLVCYVPRGYARSPCGNDALPKTFRFVSPSQKDTARARIYLTQANRL
jgi:prepilin-type N-terminal cleavage/methylation domain-containing protein